MCNFSIWRIPSEAAFALSGPFNRVSETFFSSKKSFPFPPKLLLKTSKHQKFSFWHWYWNCQIFEPEQNSYCQDKNSLTLLLLSNILSSHLTQDGEVEEVLQRKTDDAAIAQVDNHSMHQHCHHHHHHAAIAQVIVIIIVFFTHCILTHFLEGEKGCWKSSGGANGSTEQNGGEDGPEGGGGDDGGGGGDEHCGGGDDGVE